MFVNSEAGINKLGLISTALPEVCADSRGAGREGERPRAQPRAASSATSSQENRGFGLARSLRRCFGTCPGPLGSRQGPGGELLPPRAHPRGDGQSTGSPGSTAGPAPGWAQPRTGQLRLLLPLSIPRLSESRAAGPAPGFLAFEPPASWAEAQKWVPAPSFTRGNAGASGEVRGLRGLRDSPVSPCPPPRRRSRQHSAPRASGAAAWAALPSRPGCRGSLPRGWSLSPKRGSSANPVCQGQRLRRRGTPSHRRSPAPVGREQPGAPLLWKCRRLVG